MIDRMTVIGDKRIIIGFKKRCKDMGFTYSKAVLKLMKEFNGTYTTTKATTTNARKTKKV
jgi:hypothetical protein